jgi:hypothetical protein
MDHEVDLFGVQILEPKPRKRKGLGYLSEKELIEQVRRIFPNAKVIESTVDSDQQLNQSEIEY